MKPFFSNLLALLCVLIGLVESVGAANTWSLKTASGDFWEEAVFDVGWNSSQSLKGHWDEMPFECLTASDVGYGPNVYTYVRQNPWTYYDPLGLKTNDDYERDIEVAEENIRVREQWLQDENLSDKERNIINNDIKQANQWINESKAAQNKIQKTARDMAEFYGGDAADYYAELDDSNANVQRLMGLLEHAENQGVKDGILSAGKGDFSDVAADFGKGILVDRMLRRIPGLGDMFKKGGDDVLASNKGKRRKPGKLGQFKGTDALRRENKVARDAANSAGLNKDQKRRLHDRISGKNLSYHEIEKIAKEIKSGSR